MDPKSLFKSKTFWLAVAQAIIGVVGAFLSTDHAVQAVSGGAVLKSILDILVRLNTTQGVVITSGK